MGYAVTQKGQVILPKPVREHLGVGPGEEVEFRLNERGEVVVEKAKAGRPAERSPKWRGFFGPGLTTDEIGRMTRGDDR